MLSHNSKQKQRQTKKLAATSPAEKFAHKKSLGQNFLTSQVVPGWMTAAAQVTNADTVLEIGPGTGMLTRTLLTTGAKVLAVEADIRAVESLAITFAEEISSKQLTIYHGDIREITPKTLGLKDHSFKVVANIPYYLSGFLLRLLLETDTQPHTLTFLIQKELAERIARAKKESLLSLSVKAFGKPVYYKTVGKGHFFPMPKVDSAILTIDSINRSNFIDLDTELFFEILHLGLGKKRKQLLSNLTEKYNRDELTKVFLELNLSSTIRGEDVTLQSWLGLTKSLSTL